MYPSPKTPGLNHVSGNMYNEKKRNEKIERDLGLTHQTCLFALACIFRIASLCRSSISPRRMAWSKTLSR